MRSLSLERGVQAGCLHHLLECGVAYLRWADRRAEALRDRRSQSASLGAVEPGLEHEDVPEVEVPVAGAGLVFLPFLADGGGVGVAFFFEVG